MMSRPFLLVFLLIILIITSQFEWRQQLVADLDSTPSINQKQHQISKREEAVKEKVLIHTHTHTHSIAESELGIFIKLQIELCNVFALLVGLIALHNVVLHVFLNASIVVHWEIRQ